MGNTTLIKRDPVKDIFDQKEKVLESQVILVDLNKIEKVLSSLNTEPFRKDIYTGFFSDTEYVSPGEKTVTLKQIKKLISIFGEKKFTLCRSTLHKALVYLFSFNNYKNSAVKDKLIKLFTMSEMNHFNLGEFQILSNYSSSDFFGWLTKKEIEENFMKVLEELADLHEKFNLEKTGVLNSELTFTLLDHVEVGDWKYQELRDFSSQFEEVIKNLFCAFRRAHQNCLDMVIMEEEPW